MKKGFTLVELLIVIAISAILMALVIPSCNNRDTPNVVWETQCYIEQEKVFDRVTNGRVKYIGEDYWKVDGEVIFANMCESERRAERVQEITPIN